MEYFIGFIILCVAILLMGILFIAVILKAVVPYNPKSRDSSSGGYDFGGGFDGGGDGGD